MKANSTLSLGLRKIPINLARVLASAPNSCRDAKTGKSFLGIQFEYDGSVENGMSPRKVCFV